MKKSIYSVVSIILSVFFLSVASVHAQPAAVDDDYGVPFGQPLEVETPGILTNDTGSANAAVLVTAPFDGTLECVGGDDPALCEDGSFIYTPDPDFFTGSDTFTYVTNDGAGGPDSNEATVTLTACTGGPQLFSCWKEASYLDKVAELGYGTFQEGFENDTTWGSAREPDTAVSVTSRGIQWETNHPDPPANNGITTGTGPARTGLWGIYDPAHGYATGTPQECDINNPPEHCLYYDGFTGIRQAGQSALHAVGGFIKGFTGASVALILDGDVINQIGLGKLPGPGHQFFGVIDDGATGFTEFEFRELDGKVGQIMLIFADDFTLATLCVDAGDCDDSNVCTDDTCIGGACSHTPNTDPCDDGLFCNGHDTCSGGSCSTHGGSPCVDDGMYCNGTENCDEASNQCLSSGNPCLDELYCNGIESCNEITHACTPGANPCPSDGFFCTGVEACNEINDQCTQSGDPCPPLVCDEGANTCVDCLVDGDCNDFTVCTDDACTGSVCQYTPNTNPCDDGLFCTGTDTCSDGTCVHSGDPCPPLVCHDDTDECLSGDTDSDGDGILDGSDNCLETPNGPDLGTCTSGVIGTTCLVDGECGIGGFCSSNQEDTYPPGGNSIGDACDCESDFNCDGNVDAADVSDFLTDFGRSIFFNPCTNGMPCKGDFNCDVNVDATDVDKFLEDFGRSLFFNLCPANVPGDWCVY